MPYVRTGQRKVLTKRKRSSSAPSVLINELPSKRAKRSQWTEIQMKKALDAVKSGKSGVNQAARDHGVPPTTLKDRLSGRVKENTKPGASRYLNDMEEKELSTFVKGCASIGYGKTRSEVMRIAETHAKEKGLLRKEKISQGWWRNFVSRQGDISLRKGDNTAHVRMDAMNSETINHYFDLLESTLKDNGLLHSPSQIYNVDESGMPLDPKAPNIVAETGTKKVRYRCTGRKRQITIVACGNAVGQIIPPTIIYEGKKMNHSWTNGEVPGTMYGCSDKGWITTDLFKSWLSDQFLINAVSARPLLLILDGHSTHNQPEVIRYAKENDVIILCLPPHTTHETQPLDCAVFSPLKTQWRKVSHDFLQSHPGQVITKFNFNGLFAKAWVAAITPGNLISGFKTCGIYPLNRLAINIPESTSATACSDTADCNTECSASVADTLASDHNTQSSTTVSDIPASDRNAQSSEAFGDTAASDPDVAPQQFTADQEALFKRRFEEQYDVFIDEDYVRWLNLNHPEFRVVETPGALDDNPVTGFPDPCDTSRDDMRPSDEVACNSTESLPVSGNEAVSRPTSPLSNLLVCPGLNASTAPKRPSTRARLLTSNESLRLLEEKEQKKEAEALEKEKRKNERAAKKKEREELQQKKRDERARKAEDRAKKAEDKAKTSKARAVKKKKSHCVWPRSSTTQQCPSTAEPGSSVHTDTQEEKVTQSTSSGENDECIDGNTCCMCFGHYDDDVIEGSGADWIFCKCGRWLHEDCIEEVVKDNDGVERFCSFCVDKYTL